MTVLDFIPILGPIAAGFIAGAIAGGGVTRGLVAGFLSGIIGAVLFAGLVFLVAAIAGTVVDLPAIGVLAGGAIGLFILLMSLYNGLLGLLGGAVGGSMRRVRV